MKRGLVFIASLFMSVVCYSQNRFLMLKRVSDEHFDRQDYADTIYVQKKDNQILFTAKNGKVVRCVLNKSGDVELRNGWFHMHGKSGEFPCGTARRIVMDESMTLLLNQKGDIVKSNHYDHGSHMSHYSSR